jgi:hypothetical protein
VPEVDVAGDAIRNATKLPKRVLGLLESNGGVRETAMNLGV